MDEQTSAEPKPSAATSIPDDYSDVAPEDEQDPAVLRRRYQRGGRKQSENDNSSRIRASRIPPLPTPDIPPEIPYEDDEEDEIEDDNDELNEGQEDEIPEQEQKAPVDAKPSKTKTKQQPTPFETGIRAFNLQRAASSGGRPVEVRPQKEKSKKKSKKSKKKGKKQKAMDESDEDSESSSDEEKEKEGGQRPMSIRLDLNLVVEIFLKAKIQGDVTITFL